LLTGHSIAEEAALYPALAKSDEKAHATKAYTEQSAAKLQMGLLQDLPPMSQEFMDKLEHIEGAVAHHVYEEEGTWFLELKSIIPAADQAKLTERYHEQFSRYMGDDGRIAARRAVG
jgi:hemerythrin superfamily protein